MRKEATQRDWIGLVFLLLIISASVVLSIKLMPHGGATTPDSLSYLDVAQNLSEGRGLVTLNTALDNPTTYVPSTTWPPLYSATLALMGGGKAPTVWTARSLNTLLLCISATLIFLIAFRLSRPTAALMASLTFVLLATSLAVYTYVWSEALFMPLSIAAFSATLIFLTHAETSAGSKMTAVYLLLAVLFASAAFLTRYIGAVFVLLVVASAFLARGTALTRLYRGATAAILAAACTMPLLYRNLTLTGHISGSIRPPSHTSLTTNLADLGSALFTNLIGSPWLALVVILGLGVAAVSYRQPSPEGTPSVRSLDRATAWAAAWAVAYLVTLALLRSWKSFDPIDTRLIAPATPFVVIAVTALAVRAGRSAGSLPLRGAVLAPFIVWGAALVYSGVTITAHATEAWKARFAPGFIAHGAYTYTNFTANPQLTATKKLTDTLLKHDPEAILLYHHPILLHFISGAPVRAVPKAKLTAEDIRRINKVGPHGYLAVLDNTAHDALVQLYGKDIERLNMVVRFTGTPLGLVQLPLPTPPSADHGANRTGATR